MYGLEVIAIETIQNETYREKEFKKVEIVCGVPSDSQIYE